MAKQIFKDLPDTSTPLNASKLNGLFDGEEAMGNIVADSIKSKNILNTSTFVKGRITPQSSGGIVNESGTTSLSTTKNTIVFTTNVAWNNGVSSGFIPVEQGTYTYSATSDKKVYFYVDTYNSSKTHIERIVEANQTGAVSRTFTIGSGVAYIRFHYETDSANTYTITNPQIEKGITATTFYPYQELDNNEIYTTGENVVGTWINGKPLYRKVIIFSLTNGSVQNVAHHISNVSFIYVKNFFAWKQSSTFSRPLNYTYSTDTNYVQVNTTNFIYLITNKQDPTDAIGYAILEYTKTTD